jgi:microcin C transport system substrate-binding protein
MPARRAVRLCLAPRGAYICTTVTHSRLECSARRSLTLQKGPWRPAPGAPTAEENDMRKDDTPSAAVAAARPARSGRGVAAALLGLVLALAWLALPARGAAQETTTAHGISTFGELRYPADFAHLDYVNPDAPKGGEISVWSFGSFDSMNPYTTKGRAAGLSSIFFESLLEGTADEVDAAYGLLAESLEYPEDRSWVTFTLRPEARFSDGSPVTAEDVVFSYELLRDKGLPSFRAVIAKQIASAEALDARRVKFTFVEGVPTRDLPLTAGGLPIFSKAYFEASGADFEASTLTPAVGSGPYVLDRLDVGQSVVYRRNPDYWGRNLPINQGRYNFDRIRIEYYADYNSAFEGFKGGTYTFRNEASSLSWATGYDFPAVDKGWVVKRELPDGTLAPGQSFVMNLRREKFRDPRVREALGLMFNFEWSNTTLFYGLYARIHSFWENSDMAASGPPTPEELAILEPMAAILPEGVLTDDAVMAPASSDRQLDRRNLRRASALLDDAGWTVGDDGLRRNAAGETLRVELLNDSQTFDRVLNPFVENLRRLGVDATHNRIDNAQMTSRERSFDFDMVIGNYPMSLTPGGGLEQYFGCESAETSIFNLAGYCSEAADRLIEVIKAAESREELTVAVRALDRVLRAERFWIPQWYKNVHTVAYFDIYEHPEPLPPYALGNLDFWWYDADKAALLEAAGAL